MFHVDECAKNRERDTIYISIVLHTYISIYTATHLVHEIHTHTWEEKQQKTTQRNVYTLHARSI